MGPWRTADKCTQYLDASSVRMMYRACVRYRRSARQTPTSFYGRTHADLGRLDRATASQLRNLLREIRKLHPRDRIAVRRNARTRLLEHEVQHHLEMHALQVAADAVDHGLVIGVAAVRIFQLAPDRIRDRG